jgi:hypothetical protein
MKLRIVFVLGLASIVLVNAQPSANQSNGFSFDRQHWQSLRQEVNYDISPTPATTLGEQRSRLKPKKAQPEKAQPKKWSDRFSPNLIRIVKVLSFGLVFVPVLLLLYRLFRYLSLQQKAARDSVPTKEFSQWENELREESDLLSADLSYWLDAALRNSDYRMALRFAYLQVLQALANKQLIRWRKDKTNDQYIRELLPDALSTKLTGITAVFERVWYGNKQIGKEDYDQLIKSFQILMHDIGRA